MKIQDHKAFYLCLPIRHTTCDLNLIYFVIKIVYRLKILYKNFGKIKKNSVIFSSELRTIHFVFLVNTVYFLPVKLITFVKHILANVADKIRLGKADYRCIFVCTTFFLIYVRIKPNLCLCNK